MVFCRPIPDSTRYGKVCIIVQISRVIWTGQKVVIETNSSGVEVTQRFRIVAGLQKRFSESLDE